MPGFRRRVLAEGHMGRCHHGPKAHTQLKGMEADGHTFRTARCKVYPPGLNQALAEAILAQAAAVYSGVKIPASMPDDLTSFCHADFVETDLVQPDYHRLIVQA